MNHGVQATRDFFLSLDRAFTDSATEPETQAVLSAIATGRLQAGVAPSALLLAQALGDSAHSPSLKNLKLQILSQNAHAEKSGAFTGEISAPQLQDLGVTETLIGHSERRQFFGETHAVLAKKLHSLLSQGMRVLFCLGETLQERQAGQTREVLRQQLRSALATTPEALSTLREQLSAHPEALSLAYEPVWAIGTGVVASPEQAAEAHAWVREELTELLGREWASRLPILYGGSVTPENLPGLLAASLDIDGGLIGGASLKPESFAKLLKAAASAL